MLILKGEPYETSLGVYITVSFAQNMVKLVPEVVLQRMSFCFC